MSRVQGSGEIHAFLATVKGAIVPSVGPSLANWDLYHEAAGAAGRVSGSQAVLGTF